jgi:transposase
LKQLEDIVNIMALRQQGYSLRQIAKKSGMSRNTVKKYLMDPSRPLRPRPKKEGVLCAYLPHIHSLLEADGEYQATRIYDHLRTAGYGGSYAVVRRYVSSWKGEKAQKAYIAFETEPGRQAQVDFGEFQVELEGGRVERYFLFAMILGYSRKLYAEFVEQCDLPTFLDCHIRAFAYFGGVPGDILYDRMKNVYLGRLMGKDRFNGTLLSFAAQYGFRPQVAPAYSPWVKGKVERPFLYVRENFWRGYGFTGRENANVDLWRWLLEKEQRVHGTTHEVVAHRFERERPFLSALPKTAFDTSFRIYRKVRKDCVVVFEGNRFVVSHHLVGKDVLLRVKNGRMRVYAGDALVVEYAVPEGKGHLVSDPRFYKALREDAAMAARKYAKVSRHKARAKKTIGLLKPRYEMDAVERRPLSAYDCLLEAA